MAKDRAALRYGKNADDEEKKNLAEGAKQLKKAMTRRNMMKAMSGAYDVSDVVPRKEDDKTSDKNEDE